MEKDVVSGFSKKKHNHRQGQAKTQGVGSCFPANYGRAVRLTCLRTLRNSDNDRKSCIK